MKHCRMYFLPFLLLMAAVVCSAVTFTADPVLSGSGSDWTVTFTLSEVTDVEVAIIDMRDSTIVRHLAAGLLGPNAPTPLKSNSPSQTIPWDGKNDFGEDVDFTSADLNVRVRAGMKTVLDTLMGENPYSFLSHEAPKPATHYLLGGIVGDPEDGSVYICGIVGPHYNTHVNKPTLSIRKYDSQGRYLKTVYPYPANLNQTDVSGWGAMADGKGGYVPRHSNTAVPTWSNTIFAYQHQSYRLDRTSQLLMINPDGHLVFGGVRECIALGKDGSMPGTGDSTMLITSPKIPFADNYKYYRSPKLTGAHFITPIPGTRQILLSGIYQGTYQAATDTGFYQDGQVFKVDLTTGTAVSWLNIGSFPKTMAQRKALFKLEIHANSACYTSSIRGTAIDSAGNVFVCNRVANEIGVYSGDGDRLGSIPMQNPENVEVAKDGSIYGASAVYSSNTIHIKLYKFQSWAQGGTPVCTLSAGTGDISYGVMNHNVTESQIYMAVSDVGDNPMVFAGNNATSIIQCRDQGNTLVVERDWGAETERINQGFGKSVAVDRRSETVYFNDHYTNLYKISDWDNPAIVKCSTSLNKPLAGGEISFGPRYEYAYVRTGKSYGGPVDRFRPGSKFEPADFTNTNDNSIVPHVKNRWGAGYADRGFAASPDGKFALITNGYLDNRANSYCVSLFNAETASVEDNFGKVLAYPVPSRNGGVQFDLQGRLYFGTFTEYNELPVLEPFKSDYGYSRAVGSIVRWNGTDSGFVNETGNQGASRVYRIPFSPFSSHMDAGNCVCQSPRFEVDPYGRLFVPDAMSCRVSISDNEGNEITNFGEYGNIDSRGGKGKVCATQKTVSGTGVPLSFPLGVTTSEDYVYITDLGNCRIVRVQMTFEEDNLPGIGASVNQEIAMVRSAPFSLSSSPTPFTGLTNLAVTMSRTAKATLAVYSVSGQLLRRIAGGSLSKGVHRFTWDGRTENGTSLAAGVYLYRLSAGNRVLIKKAVISH